MLKDLLMYNFKNSLINFTDDEDLWDIDDHQTCGGIPEDGVVPKDLKKPCNY